MLAHRTTRTSRSGLLALVLGGSLALGVSACGGSDAAGNAQPSGQAAQPSASDSGTATPAPSPTASPTVSSGTSPSATPSASASPVASSSPAPATPRCTAADVSLALSDGGGAAGTTYYRLTMTNTSDHACRSGGYGGVSLVAAAGRQIGAAADRDRSAGVTPFVLIPGAHATQRVGIGQALNYPTATCHPTPARGLRVYLPDETRSRFVATDGVTGCGSDRVDLLTVRPYEPVR